MAGIKDKEGYAQYTVQLKDRQTGKRTTIYIRARNLAEAKSSAHSTYGIAYTIESIG